MALSRIPLRIVQVSDVHVGGSLSFKPDQMLDILARIQAVEPDVVVIAGDLTTEGYEWEYEEAADWVSQIPFPKVIIPGNHDARNVGYLHFHRVFGDGFTRHRVEFDSARAAHLRASGYTIVGLDSSEPDINDGEVGLDRYVWLRQQFDEPDDIRVVAVHHHLVSIPGTGRERNIVFDAGDLLLTLVELDVDVVLSGHKHVPFFWGLNGMLICNSGTAATRRLRGGAPPSWNELVIDATTIKVFVHYADGRRELAVLFSRATRAMTRESFYMTRQFLRSNRVLPD